MAEDGRQDEEDIKRAFKAGDKILVENLLPRVLQPSGIMVTFDFDVYKDMLRAASVSLLHLAAFWGWMDTVTTLVIEYGMATNREDNKGHIPLHYAAYNGHLEVVKYFGLHRDLSDKKSADGRTPIFFACQNGHFHIVQYLIEEAKCNPLHVDNSGWTLIHYASLKGHLSIAQFIIKVFKDQDRNPFCKAYNLIGNTPLHLACDEDHLNIVQYLIREEHCDPSCEDNDGKTPLLYACQRNRPHIVQYLLSTGRVNPLVKDKYIHTALSYATGKYDIIKLFQPFEECRTAFPVHTFTKLILTGDSEAGKTTIAELIVRQASSTTLECITDGHHFTAGIIPYHIQSDQLGNFVLYDFAGRQEYYSSHAAILEQVMRRSAATFLCVVDLRESTEKISESLNHWLSFIDNACSTAKGQSHVIIVGSHADQVTASLKEKSSHLQKILVSKKIKRQEYKGFIAMDCRKANTNASRHLIATLTNSQKVITASQPVIHYYSHVVYAFLCTKLKVVGCTLHDLVTAIDKENDSSLPKDQSVLTEIVATLSDKGLILFLQHHQSSWIVVKTEVLLKEINGTLFAPDHFKEHRDLASNTGIVPISNLRQLFPEYNSEMLIGFLTSLNFCRPVDQSVLLYTNLQTIPSHSTTDLLFFPGLVTSERPDSLVQQGALEFGWCLKCMDPCKFFSSRFLHVLLLSVAYMFPLASQAASSSVSDLQRTCKIWRNGIFWSSLDNITMVIELIDKNRCVLVAMSCDDTSPAEHAELRSSLVDLVRKHQQQYCPHLNVSEFLISPNFIQQYPLDNLPDSNQFEDLFPIRHIARYMLLERAGVSSYKDRRGCLIIESLLSLLFEPYRQLRSSSVIQLLNPNTVENPVPSLLLHEVRQTYGRTKVKPQANLRKLRKNLDNLSLFTGRNNPLVSSV